jgi:ABC-type uncharacterized transport system permease subunit
VFVEQVLVGAVRSTASLLFAAQGELLAERSGVINLGTEGCMITGALAAFAVTVTTGNPLLGVVAGALAGALPALLHALLVIKRGTNQLATGLAITFLCLGVTAAAGSSYVDRSIEPLDRVPIPGLSDIPFVGPILFNHDALTYAALLLGPLLWVVLYRTRWGLILRATGERPEVTFAYGHSPDRVQLVAVVLGGALAGLGGAQLVLAYTLAWVENITLGRGFVAVAIVIFAAWKPLRATLGAFVFGVAVSLQLRLQATGVEISSFLLGMLPYVLTLLVLVLASSRRVQHMPSGLRSVFETPSRA